MSKSEKVWEQFLDRDSVEDLVQLTRSKPDNEVSRRTFLEVLGYSSVALAMSGCRAPQQKIVPYLKQPVEFTPGVASWFSSGCGGCSRACGTLVKVRDGRPIKLEGNPDHPLSQGGLCALAHGMVFGLYDPDRLRQPLIASQAATWNEIDQKVIERLESIKKSGGKVRLLTPPLISPTSRETTQKFLAQFSGKHITYQSVSQDAIRQAHLRSHGVEAIPQYKFADARLVVSFAADFLGTWIAPVEFTRGYANARSLQSEKREMLRHIQFESRMSLTGSNADRRVKLSPAEESGALLYLAKLVAAASPAAPLTPALTGFEATQLAEGARTAVDKTARELLQVQGQSLVLSGANDVQTQYLVNFINQSLGNYGKTIDLNMASAMDHSSDTEMVELVRQMNAGEIAALIVSGVNPAYDYFDGQSFIKGAKKVPLTVSLNSSLDETSSLTEFVCPQPNFL
ncbi:MAG TPA: hypothetical protein VNG71_04985, partial [Pyrinomonadaceae bacterium]|nr:hypothetical protein [Pyrinomonadaceae bacterium]